MESLKLGDTIKARGPKVPFDCLGLRSHPDWIPRHGLTSCICAQCRASWNTWDTGSSRLRRKAAKGAASKPG
eukprot:scaffold141_cov410-Prasinococcus_capsulatus_cf.AAC.17